MALFHFQLKISFQMYDPVKQSLRMLKPILIPIQMRKDLMTSTISALLIPKPRRLVNRPNQRSKPAKFLRLKSNTSKWNLTNLKMNLIK